MGSPNQGQRDIDGLRELTVADLGQEILLEVLGALQKAEIKKWWPIIKAAGIKAE